MKPAASATTTKAAHRKASISQPSSEKHEMIVVSLGNFADRRRNTPSRVRLGPENPIAFQPTKSLIFGIRTGPFLGPVNKGHLLPDFYSSATGPPGRFSEGFLLRRLHTGGYRLTPTTAPQYPSAFY
jgi:hypothetical protein